MKKRIVLIIILAMLLIGGIYISTFRLTDIQVSGCQVVDEKTIMEAVENTGYSGNTIMLYIGNKLKPIENIPFVAKVEIEFVSKNKVSVTVYEKSIAGCTEYMDSYVFFDKDGIILESSHEMIKGVPCIRGLEFESWEKGQKLPIKEDKKFQYILTITQLVEKYGLDIDSIKFTAEEEIILMHGGLTIELREGEYLAEQLMNLGNMLKSLDADAGILHMKVINGVVTASYSRK
ncbi:MAG: FtsQ-type POTRA domain-containing protein [Clostridium sp.]|nr:FtsQ-type POTRA domain-containing protein [Clostridium sp.]MCM1398243.1 FtsQ-type POTRA domain-containing protein [Clostridium sp.]MCM1460343.1 FtsQ-type POTRA domain-containing protein [Bacteroides sp.]